MMKILLYNNTLENIGERIRFLVRNRFPQLDIVVLDSVQQISRLLSRPLHSISVFILPIASIQELDAFQKMHPMLDQIRVILILPDRDTKTLARAVQVKSSFITYIDNDINDIAAVLEKLAQKLHITFQTNGGNHEKQVT
jgi:hypothetical protein